MSNTAGIKNQDLFDCTTNVFSLADIRGLRWKKYKSSCINSTSIADDPILNAYTVALRLDVLCVWRRIPQAGLHEEIGARLFGCAKELIIFWYGEEPAITQVPGPAILEIDSGCVEDGIPPDYLDLFFKSIHNIIEKNLLGSDFVRLGKWFTKPLKTDPDNNSVTSSLAFRFSIFIHGESSVVTAVNIEEKNAVRSFSRKDILKKSVHSTEHKVLLAPYGLNAQLTGYSLSEGDIRAAKILEEWRRFFPINITGGANKLQPLKSDCCTSVVEVMLGEVKMLYPACLVLIPVIPIKDGFPQTPLPFSNASDSQESKQSFQKSSSKVTDTIWETVKKLDVHNRHQLWHLRDNYYQAGCGCCSKTNTTRAKVVNNTGTPRPFNSSTSAQNCIPNIHTSKKKKENASPLSSFHQRIPKLKKAQGRVTPSLSGRVTPAFSNSSKIASRSCSTDKPQITAVAPLSNGQTEISISESIKTENQLHFVSSNLSAPTLSTLPKNAHTEEETNSDKNKMIVYNLPQASKLKAPKLPCNTLDPFYEESVKLSNMTEIQISSKETSLADGSIKLDPVPSQRGKSRSRSKDSQDVLHCTAMKYDVDAAAIDREQVLQSGCSSSILSPISPVNLSVLPDDDKSIYQAANHARLSVKTETLSPIAEYPQPRQNQSRKRKPGTVVTENQVFTFGSKVIRLPSPPTPHFSPTVKTSSLMNTKDLVPISDDLDHLFDDDEDENSGFKKIPLMPISDPINGPPSVEDTSTKLITASLPSSSSSSVTQQDLARMFPTPPSDLSPIMSIHHETQGSVGAPATCISILSTEMTHSAVVSECENMETNIEQKPSGYDSMTFCPPLIQMQDIPHSYTPLSLPSDSYKASIREQLKYVPSWDPSPPILSRRPSGQRLQPVAPTIVLKQGIATIDQKMNLHLAPGSLHPPYFNLSPQTMSPITANMDDNQSLMVNLTLTDSYMNWLSVNDISNQSVQGKTFKLFIHYQNAYWKNYTDANLQSDLFPEAELLHISRGDSLVNEVKQVEQLDALSLTFVPEIAEVLLKSFVSPFAVEYLHHVLDNYYASQSHPFTTKNVRKCPMGINKLLKKLQLCLQHAMQKPVCKSIFDTPKVEGPLSFKKLDKLSKKKGMQSVLSGNSLLLHYEGDAVSISPSSMKHWQHLQLEPCGGTKNVAYIVALPESEFIVNSAKQFFKELNSVYEALNLGLHFPIAKDLRDGLIRITQKSVQKVSAVVVDDWFSQNDSQSMARLKTVAQFCKQHLGPYLANLNLDSTFTIKSDSTVTSAAPSKPAVVSTSFKSSNPVVSSTLKPEEQAASVSSVSVGYSSQDQNNNTSPSPGNASTIIHEEGPHEVKQETPTLVIYMVDPFHLDAGTCNSPNFWSYFGLMRCFVEMYSVFTEKLKENILFQVIPLEQILQIDLNARGKDMSGSHNRELKNLALSIYSRCRADPMRWMKKTEKCMTGFGICNSRDHLMRRRQVDSILYPPLYLPPYILAKPSKFTKVDLNASPDTKMAVALIETEINILFCSYCLSIDNRWLLVSCTDRMGELSESTFIKIVYPKRKKSKALVWSIVIRKLWEFINTVTSFSVSPWRVVLSKLGSIDQYELKELESVLQKQIQSHAPVQQGCQPTSPLHESCICCSVEENQNKKCIIKSISVCNIDEKCDINFVAFGRTQQMNLLNSTIYVMPSSKGYVNISKSKNNSLSRCEMLPPEHGFINTPFDEENEREALQNFLPMLSPADMSVFQTSPQTDMAKMLSSPQNVVSPQSNLNNTMTSLSPFTPIPSKQAFMASPARSSCAPLYDHNESCGNLSVGYLLTGCTLDDDPKFEPHIMKCGLHQHFTLFAGNCDSETHPLDSKNYMEVLKFVLECFNSLSWLTTDPSTGTRHSCLPVHVRTLVTSRKFLKEFST